MYSVGGRLISAYVAALAESFFPHEWDRIRRSLKLRNPKLKSGVFHTNSDALTIVG
jgi:hypothetical protein